MPNPGLNVYRDGNYNAEFTCDLPYPEYVDEHRVVIWHEPVCVDQGNYNPPALGASSVFGRYLRDTPWRARIAPIVAGLGLLAFTGTGGENTDLVALLLGFVSGLGCGLGFARFTRIDTLRSRRRQSLCAAVALGAVLAAWTWGLLAAG